jgi:predicted house-cleaning noncanonical NTP pyrophosphatase (MazG superfamily)
MLKFKVNKLVRDKIPDILKLESKESELIVLNDKDYLNALKQKLIEETHEVVSATTKSDICDELADVLEVIHALASLYNISLSDINNKRLDLKKSKGGFDKKIFLNSITLSTDHPALHYFLSNPQKYPKIS